MLATIRCASVAALLGLLAGAAAAQGALLVVDAAGGAGSVATSISDAISLAQDGDTILVRAGSYLPFTIENRTLVVTAEPGAEVIVQQPTSSPDGTTIVRGISLGQVVVLEGLQLIGGFSGGDNLDALRVEQCEGQIWIQRCTLGTTPGVSPPQYAGLEVVDSDNVLVVRSQCLPVEPSFFGGVNGAGLLETNSHVYAFESSFTGGVGAQGADLQDSFLFAEQSTFQGGAPHAVMEDGICFLITPAGNGLEDFGASRVEFLESSSAGGSLAGFFPCAQDGQAVVGLPPHVSPGPALSFSVDSPTLDGQPSNLTLSGPPGDHGLVLVATSLPPVKFIGKFKGALATGSPFLFLLGPLPPSGQLVVPLNFGDALAPGSASTVFLQGGVLNAGGGGQIGDPVAWTTFEE